MTSAKPACIECGGSPVPHTTTYISVLIDETARPLFALGPISRVLATLLHKIERRVTPYILSFFASLGVAKIVTAPDEKTMLLAKVTWEEAERRGITVVELRLFGLARNLFLATSPNGRRLVYEGVPLPHASLSQAWWLDNKAEMKKRFQKAGIPVAKGGAALTFFGAKRIFKKLAPPVIVKPYSGSASRHTTLHINDKESLARAFAIATQVAPLAIIEEELVGPVFRATVVDGKLIGVLRRDPPWVQGDGVHTIAALVQEANKHPARSGPYFSPMNLDEDAHTELSWQGYTPESIPPEGKRITLHQKVNWSLGGTTTDVTDETHEDNKVLFEKVAHVLKAPLVGLDFIILDITTSWKEQERSGVIECNSMPFFDNHHLPFEGEPRNVAGALWDLVKV